MSFSQNNNTVAIDHRHSSSSFSDAIQSTNLSEKSREQQQQQQLRHSHTNDEISASWTNKLKCIGAKLAEIDADHNRLRNNSKILREENNQLREIIEHNQYFNQEAETKRKEMKLEFEKLISKKNLQLAEKEKITSELIQHNESLSESISELKTKLKETFEERDSLIQQTNIQKENLERKNQALMLGAQHLKEQMRLNEKYEKSLKHKQELLSALDEEKTALEAEYQHFKAVTSEKIDDLNAQVCTLNRELQDSRNQEAELDKKLEEIYEDLCMSELTKKEMAEELRKLKTSKPQMFDRQVQTQNQFLINKTTQTESATQGHLKSMSTQTPCKDLVDSGAQHDQNSFERNIGCQTSQQSFSEPENSDSAIQSSQIVNRKDEKLFQKTGAAEAASIDFDIQDIDFENEPKQPEKMIVDSPIAASSSANFNSFKKKPPYSPVESSIKIARKPRDSSLSHNHQSKQPSVHQVEDDSADRLSFFDTKFVKEMDDSYYLNKNLLYSKQSERIDFKDLYKTKDPAAVSFKVPPLKLNLAAKSNFNSATQQKKDEIHECSEISSSNDASNHKKRVRFSKNVK